MHATDVSSSEASFSVVAQGAMVASSGAHLIIRATNI